MFHTRVCFFIIFCSCSSILFANAEEDLWNSFHSADYDLAERYAREALKENASSARMHYNLGVVFYQKQKFDEALASFNNAIRLGDEKIKSKAFYNRGMVEIMQSNLQSARKSMATALSYALDDHKIKENLEWIDEQLKNQTHDQQQTSADQSDQPEAKKSEDSGANQQNQKSEQASDSPSQDSQDSQREDQKQSVANSDEASQDMPSPNAEEGGDDQQSSLEESKKSQQNQASAESSKQGKQELNGEQATQLQSDEKNQVDEREQVTANSEEKSIDPSKGGDSTAGQVAASKSISVDEMKKQDAEKLLRQVDDQIGRLYYPSDVPLPPSRQQDKDW